MFANTSSLSPQDLVVVYEEVLREAISNADRRVTNEDEYYAALVDLLYLGEAEAEWDTLQAYNLLNYRIEQYKANTNESSSN